MKRFLIFIAVIFAIILGYLFFAPTKVEPVAWQAPEAPSLESGPFKANNLLAGIERIAVDQGKGPEAIAFDAQGRIYTGYADGRIARFEADGTGYTLIANTGGRPLGLAFHPDGSLIVCDANKGLLRITADGKITVLSASADGVPFKFTDDLAITKDGSKAYFTDASSRWGYGQSTEDIIEHRNNGRFLVYDFASATTQVLLPSLQFANGVALGPDENFVLVNETGNYRIMRFWLKGPKAGSADIFADNLPGFPDNITFNGRDRFWVALYAPRAPIADILADKPYMRKMFMRALDFIPLPIRHEAFALAFDINGKLVANLQDNGPNAYSPVTSVREHTDGYLYFGSLTANSMARIKMPPLPAGISTP